MILCRHIDDTFIQGAESLCHSRFKNSATLVSLFQTTLLRNCTDSGIFIALNGIITTTVR